MRGISGSLGFGPKFETPEESDGSEGSSGGCEDLPGGSGGSSGGLYGFPNDLRVDLGVDLGVDLRVDLGVDLWDLQKDQADKNDS